MNRTSTKITLVVDLILYVLIGAVSCVVGLVMATVSGGLALMLIPGMLLLALVCLVAPSLITMVAGLLPLDAESVAAVVNNPSEIFNHMGRVVNNAFTVNPTKPAFALSSVCLFVSFVVGLVCLVMVGKMYFNADSPMDWYAKRTKRHVVYAVFCTVYVLCALVAACAVIFSGTGGFLLVSAIVILICALMIGGGAVVLFVDRRKSMAAYEVLSYEEQVALCDKQAEYMKKRVRKRQVKKLGEDARYTPELLEKSSGKKGGKGKGEQESQPIEAATIPVDYHY